jgi:NhaP-type Na+/H+ or K+/H+ antiporter
MRSPISCRSVSVQGPLARSLVGRGVRVQVGDAPGDEVADVGELEHILPCARAMSFTLGFIVAGVLLVTMAIADSLVRRLPASTALLYVGAGVLLGPMGWGLVRLEPLEEAAVLERLTEIVVIVSLFAAGLKLRTPLTDPIWRVPVALALGSMALTVGMIALLGWLLLGLPPGGAVLLGAVLAPTDPVLASEVQVAEPTDRDRLRFGLTGEAGLNDGAAFPFVMLGLGLLGVHELGAFGWRWWVVDVLWAILGGLGVGTVLGTLVGYLVIYLRREHKEALGLDDFLALGLIALSYGVALLVHTYGFLAVFAAGLAVRRIERLHSGEEPPPLPVRAASEDAEAVATDPETAHAYMADAVLGFSEQLERIGTLGVVVLLGAMLSARWLPPEAAWFVPLLFLVVRPLAVGPALLGSGMSRLQRRLVAWFGIRGIGSLYYLAYAIERGVPDPVAARLTGITLAVVTASIVAHGVSVSPLMSMYTKRHQGRPDGAGATV